MLSSIQEQYNEQIKIKNMEETTENKEVQKEPETEKEVQKEPETEKEVQKEPETEKEVQKEPLGKYVICSKCKMKKACRTDIYENRVKKFGSVEKLNAEYVCRDCKKKE